MERSTYSQQRLVTLIIVAILIIGVAVIASDWAEMKQVLSEADWRYIPIVMVFTFFSYACFSLAYAYVCDLLEIRMGKRELAEVCFISTVVNHVITTGGVAGFSLRYLMMKLYNVSLNDIITSTILHHYLTSLDMLTFLPITFYYLLTHAAVPRVLEIALGVMTLLFGLILILTTGLILFPSRRSQIIHFVGRLGLKILHRDYLPFLNQLDETLTRGTSAIRQHPLLLVWIMVLTLVDFFCSITAMGFVFKALGASLSPAVLVTGYVIGILAGQVSMIPGGLGVQEGSMAGIYALLGVPFGQALLAAVLFRVLYYLVPYFLILPFSNRLLRKARQQATIES